MKEETRKQIIHLLKEKKLIIGTKTTIKALKKGQLQKIYISQNAPQTTAKEITTASQALQIPVEHLNIKSKQLGTQCGKPHPITTLGVKKE